MTISPVTSLPSAHRLGDLWTECGLFQASQSHNIWEEKYYFYIKTDKMHYGMEYKIQAFVRGKTRNFKKFSQASCRQFRGQPNLFGVSTELFMKKYRAIPISPSSLTIQNMQNRLNRLLRCLYFYHVHVIDIQCC